MSYLTSDQVIGRYHISQMTLWRWQKDEEMRFPKPMIINRRRYWREEDLRSWEPRQIGLEAVKSTSIKAVSPRR